MIGAAQDVAAAAAAQMAHASVLWSADKSNFRSVHNRCNVDLCFEQYNGRLARTRYLYKTSVGSRQDTFISPNDTVYHVHAELGNKLGNSRKFSQIQKKVSEKF